MLNIDMQLEAFLVLYFLIKSLVIYIWQLN